MIQLEEVTLGFIILSQRQFDDFELSELNGYMSEDHLIRVRLTRIRDKALRNINDEWETTAWRHGSDWIRDLTAEGIEPNPGPDENLEDYLVKHIVESHYSTHQIDTIAADTFMFIEDPTDTNMVTLFKKYPSLFQRMSFFSKNLSSCMSHFFACLDECKNLMVNGYYVHLLEGTSALGYRLLEDIDILCTKNGRVILIDITKGDRDYTEFERPSKYAKLRSKFSKLEFDMIVRGRDVKIDMGPMKISDVKTDVFSDEFENVTRCLSVIDELTLADCQSLLKRSSELIKVPKIKMKDYNPHEKFFKPNEDVIIKAIEENSVASCMIFNQFKALGDKNYNTQYSDMIGSDSLPVIKTNVKVPRLETSDIADPFKTIQELINRGCDHEFILALSASTPEEKDFGKFRMSRVTNKEGEMVNMVKLVSNEGTVLDLLSSYNFTEPKKPILNYHKLEEEMNRVENVLSESSTCRDQWLQDISSLAIDSMGESGLEDFQRDILIRCVNEISRSKLIDLICCISRVYHSILYSTKKFPYSGKGSVTTNTCYLSVDQIEGRLGISLSNSNSSQFEVKDKTSMVFGAFVDDGLDYLIKPYNIWNTDWFCASAADQEWYSCVYHKTVSYLTMFIDKELTSQPLSVKSKKDFFIKSSCYSCLLMTINSSKFSQVTEAIRFAFVNITGISVGTKEMYEKISWYLPKCNGFLQSLFLHRMVKMTSLTELVSSNNCKAKLVAGYCSSSGLPSCLSSGSSWKICFPHEKRHNPSEQSGFNSIYVCKMLTVTRFTKTMSESMVLQKEIKNNLKFRIMYDTPLPTDVRYCKCRTIENLKEYILDMCVFEGDTYRPNFSILLLSVINNHCQHMMSQGCDVGEKIKDFVDRMYDPSETILNMNLNMVSNNRGMVSINQGQCVGAVRLEKSEIKTRQGKYVKKEQLISQNTKGFLGLYQYTDMFYKNITCTSYTSKEDLIKPLPDLKKSESLNEESYQNLAKASTSLLPMVVNSYTQKHMCVAKMVHKDQIGPREIAVTNPVLRLNAFSIEEISRYCRKQERLMDDHVNLIEEHDKDDVVDQSWHKNLIIEKNKRIVYDSADCSQWGPSMLPYVLYLCLGSRVNGNHRELIRELFKQFSKKVFKIPDNLYLYSKKMGDTGGVNSVRAVVDLIKSIKNEYSLPSINYESQFLISFQGMFQGILGNCSSLFAHDCLLLSSFYHKEILDIDVVSYDTSDDYLRILYLPDDDKGVYNHCSSSLSLHVFVSKAMGITRNMYKSNFSEHLCEFNSRFRTKTGIFDPDVKSRLSYISTSGIYDWYESSLRPSNMAVEYLCNGGSVIGSLWVQILNTHLELISSGRINFYRENRGLIFRIPLELGGMVRIDPLRNSTEPLLCVLKQNYDQNGRLSYHDVSILLSCTSNAGIFDEIEGNSDETIKIPALSRSSMINMMSRIPKSKRKIYEFLSGVPSYYLIPYISPGFKRSMLSSLLSCMQRESADDSHQSIAVQFVAPQTPKDAIMYKVNNDFYKLLLMKEKLSRSEILSFGKAFNEVEIKIEESCVYLGTVKFENYSPMFDSETCEIVAGEHDMVMKSIKPKNKGKYAVTSINKFIRSENYMIDTDPSGVLSEELINSLLSLLIPKELGGSYEGTLLQYILSERVLKSRIQKMTTIRRCFQICGLVEEQDRTIIEKTLMSNFMEGSRLEFVCIENMSDAKVRINSGLYNRGLNNLIRHCSCSPSPLRDSQISNPKMIYQINESFYSRVDITLLLSELNTRTWTKTTEKCIQFFHELFRCQGMTRRQNPLFRARLSNNCVSRKHFKKKSSVGKGLVFDCVRNPDSSINHTVVRVQTSQSEWKVYLTLFDCDDSIDTMRRRIGKGDETFVIRVPDQTCDVSLKSVNGCLILSSGSHLISYICDSPETRTNKITFIGMSFGTPQELSSLKIRDYKETEQLFQSFFFEPSVAFAPEPDSIDAPEFLDEDWVDGVDEELFETDEKLESESMSSEEEEITSRVSSSRTDTSVFVRDNFTLSDSFRYDKAKSCWYLMMPSKYGHQVYDDSGGTSPLSKFLSSLKGMDYFDAMWAKSCLISAMVKSKDYKRLENYISN